MRADFFNSFTLFLNIYRHRENIQRKGNKQPMEAWIAANWGSILLSLVTTGALTFCGWCWKQMKTYKKLLDEKKEAALDEAIEEKIEPVKQDIQQLRDYVAQVDTAEKHKMDLIVSSYRYRLT